MHDETYEGTSTESFEDAVANAGVPGSPVPTRYEVTLAYTSPGGINPEPLFHATLRLPQGGSLEEPGQAAVG